MFYNLRTNKSVYQKKFNKAQTGFTLIELVAVIVIVGILAVASVQFISFGTQIYVQANDRQVVLAKSRFAIERMTREIRGAIPNSVRVSGDNRCIEFVPIKASGAYRDDSEADIAPIFPASASTAMQVVSWLGDYHENDKLFIYPTNISSSNHDIYNNSSTKVATVETASGTSPQLTIIFTSAVQFSEHSPRRRYYTADHSVNYCLISNGTEHDLYRFTKTDFDSPQSAPTEKTNELTNDGVLDLGGVLMAEGLTNSLADSSSYPFDISTDTLNRNSVVNVYLEFKANLNENMFFNHEIHIPNVP